MPELLYCVSGRNPVKWLVCNALVNVNHQGPPAGIPRGFWHLKISSLKVPTLICTFCVRIPSISYPRRGKSLYFKCQNCPWIRKLSESLGLPVGALGIHTDWFISKVSMVTIPRLCEFFGTEVCLMIMEYSAETGTYRVNVAFNGVQLHCWSFLCFITWVTYLSCSAT